MKNIPSIRVIKESRLDAVIHTKTKREAIMLVKILGVDEERFYDENDFIECWDGHKENTCYRIRNGKVDQMDCVKFYQKINEEIYEFSDLFATGGVVSIHDLPTSECYKHFTVVKDEIDALEHMANNVCNRVDITDFDAQRLAKRLADISTRFEKRPFDISTGLKEEKNLKFTFYTEEGYRIDKSNNSKVETITTFVKVNGFDNTYLGMATCDKVDYSEREGVINALANAMCNGNFDREFNKAVKDNARADKKARTCIYCGQLFDTVSEKDAHEAWHVERRKARHERYLLRKRAKEIAFEEQAQKMAKEIIAEDKKK